MGKIAGNHDVTVIDRFAASRLQARQQLDIAIGLSVIFTPGVQ
jgi:hypothetical protein